MTIDSINLCLKYLNRAPLTGFAEQEEMLHVRHELEREGQAIVAAQQQAQQKQAAQAQARQQRAQERALKRTAGGERV